MTQISGKILSPLPSPGPEAASPSSGIADLQQQKLVEGEKSAAAFLTGLSCLEPVSEPCLSGLFRLWRGPETNTAKSQQSEAELELAMLGKIFLLESFGKELGEMLHEGLSRYFSREPEATPRPPEAECEVRKSAEGEIRVECSAQ